MKGRAYQLNRSDNVATMTEPVEAGGEVVCGGETAPGGQRLTASDPIARGHKVAIADVPAGSPILKFGIRIGHATRAISRGQWVHLHNVASDIDTRSSTLDLHTGAPTDTRDAYG